MFSGGERSALCHNNPFTISGRGIFSSRSTGRSRAFIPFIPLTLHTHDSARGTIRNMIALPKIIGTQYRVGTAFYAVQRFIAVYLSTHLWPGFTLVHGDESPDAIKSGPIGVKLWE